MTLVPPNTFPLIETPESEVVVKVASPVPEVGGVALRARVEPTDCFGTRRKTDEPLPLAGFPVGPSTVVRGTTTIEARTVDEAPPSVAVTSNNKVVSAVTFGVIKEAVGPVDGEFSNHFATGVTVLHSPFDAFTSSAVVHNCFHEYTAPSPLPSVDNKIVDGTRLPFTSTS